MLIINDQHFNTCAIARLHLARCRTVPLIYSGTTQSFRGRCIHFLTLSPAEKDLAVPSINGAERVKEMVKVGVSPTEGGRRADAFRATTSNLPPESCCSACDKGDSESQASAGREFRSTFLCGEVLPQPPCIVVVLTPLRGRSAASRRMPAARPA